MPPSELDTSTSVQNLILKLQNYGADKGCAILQPFDMEVGAGTFHPATFLRAIGPNHGKLHMFNLLVDQGMDVMVKTPIAFNIITNFRSYLSLRLVTFKTFTLLH